MCFQTKQNKAKNRRLQEAAVSQCRAGTEGEAMLGREAELGQRGRSKRRQYPVICMSNVAPPSLMRHWVQKDICPSVPENACACTCWCRYQALSSPEMLLWQRGTSEGILISREEMQLLQRGRESAVIRWMWFWGRGGVIITPLLLLLAV